MPADPNTPCESDEVEIARHGGQAASRAMVLWLIAVLLSRRYRDRSASMIVAFATATSAHTALRQEITRRHVRVGVVEPGGVATQLGSHNKPEIRKEMIDPFNAQTEVLAPEDIAYAITYMVTRPRHTSHRRATDHAHR